MHVLCLSFTIFRRWEGSVSQTDMGRGQFGDGATLPPRDRHGRLRHRPGAHRVKLGRGSSPHRPRWFHQRARCHAGSLAHRYLLAGCWKASHCCARRACTTAHWLPTSSSSRPCLPPNPVQATESSAASPDDGYILRCKIHNLKHCFK
jgi:hypothetical protein